VGIGVAPAAKLDVHDSANNQRLIRISHPTSPTEAGGYLGFASDGTTDNNLVVLGVQYSGTYYDALSIQRSTRLATFSGGITVSGANNWSHISSKDTQSLTLADDAQIQLADAEAGAMLIHIYDRSQGRGGLIFAAYGGQPVILADPSSAFANSDTDTKFCVYKTSGSHDVYFKNRTGSSTLFGVLVTAATLDDF
jgi:hypothetical protein